MVQQWVLPSKVPIVAPSQVPIVAPSEVPIVVTSEVPIRPVTSRAFVNWAHYWLLITLYYKIILYYN